MNINLKIELLFISHFDFKSICQIKLDNQF